MQGGLYQLVLRVESPVDLEVGGLGPVTFEEGYYVYTGSAKRGLDARVARHMRREKKVRWHIDVLTACPDVTVVSAWIFPHPPAGSTECALNQATEALTGATIPVRGFGSSDCKAGCEAHLIAFGRVPPRLPAPGVTFSRIEMGSPGPMWEQV